MNTAPGYVCKNCGHIEPPDPLNLRRWDPFSCKRCGKDYRNSPTNIDNSRTTNSEKAEVVHFINLLVGMVKLSTYVPWPVRIMIGLISTIITYLYCTSITGSVAGVNLIPIYQFLIPIEYDLPWAIAGIISVIVGGLTMTVVVGLVLGGIIIAIVAAILFGLYFGVDYFGGWG